MGGDIIMMTKKSEMAEWILDFFRRANVNAGEIILFRNVQNKLYELNPKERNLFVPVTNELIENGYFTYEEGSVQCLRLTEKGRDYIYNPDAVLDCCQDVWKPTRAQSQYIATWHDNFVNYVNRMLTAIATLEMQQQATDADKQGFDALKLLLNGKDVQEVESDLANGVVSQATLDKIEKLNKDLVDIAIDHIDTHPLWKQFMKQLFSMKVESDKTAEMMRLRALQIPVKQ